VHTYLDLLGRNHNYRNLWLAKMVSYLGDWFNLLASATLIASLTGSGTAISFLFLARFLPLFFVSPVAGVVADRYSRRLIMIISDVLRALTVLGFLLIRSSELIWLFYGLTILQFTLSAFFTPAQTALLPKVVHEDELVAANALDGFTWSSMLAIGAMLGGLATAYLGITAAFVIDAFTFLLSAWFVSRIDLPRATANERLAQANQGSGFFEFVGGLRYLAGRPFILGLSLVKGGGALVWGAINVVEIPLAQELFALNGNGTLTLGLVYAATGIGTALGPILMRQWLGDSRSASLLAITIGFVMLTIGVVGLGLANMFSVVLVMTIVRGIGSGAAWVFSSALLQKLVTDEYRGRVFAFEFAIFTLTQSISVLWAGFAMDSLGLGVQQVLLSMGIAGTAATLVWLIFRARYVPQPVPA
jgi:MFS family permease